MWPSNDLHELDVLKYSELTLPCGSCKEMFGIKSSHGICFHFHGNSELCLI